MDTLKHKVLKHYNIAGHAHELTCSCDHRRNYLNDSYACEMVCEEIAKARKIYNFQLWAYVLMPNHFHLLIWPMEPHYDIAKIESGIKGVMARMYKQHLQKNAPDLLQGYEVHQRGKLLFTFWQPGGGFDRNLWNPKAINASIAYIEANPVRRGLVTSAEKWPWSSAFARNQNKGLVADEYNASVTLLNP